MNWPAMFQAIATAVALAIIFGIAKLFQRLLTLETKTEPLIEWWKKTSMDALKIATNPTSERLTQLADKYIECVKGQGTITTAEKQELIDGLREVLSNPREQASKRQSASMSLRFIETREGLTAKKASNANH